MCQGQVTSFFGVVSEYDHLIMGIHFKIMGFNTWLYYQLIGCYDDLVILWELLIIISPNHRIKKLVIQLLNHLGNPFFGYSLLITIV